MYVSAGDYPEGIFRVKSVSETSVCGQVVRLPPRKGLMYFDHGAAIFDFLPFTST